MIQTTEVAIRRSCEVDAAFALAQGEDGDLAGRRAGHRRYVARNGGFEPGMKLVRERFRPVEDLAGG